MPGGNRRSRGRKNLPASLFSTFSGLAAGAKIGALYGLLVGVLADALLLISCLYNPCCGIILVLVGLPFLLLVGGICGALWGGACSSLGSSLGSVIPRLEFALTASATLGAIPGTILVIYLVEEWPAATQFGGISTSSNTLFLTTIATAVGLALTGSLGSIAGVLIGRSAKSKE